MDEEGGLHVVPGHIEMHLSYGHVFVEGHHIRSFVVLWSSEESSKELHHGRVQFGDIADVLQKVFVDFLVGEDILVKLSDHPLQLIMPAQPLE